MARPYQIATALRRVGAGSAACRGASGCSIRRKRRNGACTLMTRLNPSSARRAFASFPTLTTKYTLWPVTFLALVFTCGCGATPESSDSSAEADEVESSQAALAPTCGGVPITTQLQPEFTLSIPQALSRLKITARNPSSITCSRAATIEIRRNGTLVNTETIPARDFPRGFTTTNRGLDRQYLPPVTVKVCYGNAITCLSKTINPPIGE